MAGGAVQVAHHDRCWSKPDHRREYIFPLLYILGLRAVWSKPGDCPTRLPYRRTFENWAVGSPHCKAKLWNTVESREVFLSNLVYNNRSMTIIMHSSLHDVFFPS